MSVKNTVTKDFMLHTPEARRLYHDYAEMLPIIDYHCHLSAELIAKDHTFADAAALPAVLDARHHLGAASAWSGSAAGRACGVARGLRRGTAPAGDDQHGAGQHQQEARDADPDGLQHDTGHEQNEADDESGDRPARPTPGMRAHAGPFERCRELGVFGVQRSLHLLEQALLVL